MTSETISPGCTQVSTGRILAKSLSTPRCLGSDGAYLGIIPFYAPMFR